VHGHDATSAATTTATSFRLFHARRFPAITARMQVTIGPFPAVSTLVAEAEVLERPHRGAALPVNFHGACPHHSFRLRVQ
jgi:hypothetical protein